MLKSKISAFFLIFLVISVLGAENPNESMVSINRFPQISDVFEDYQVQTQTKPILNPAINGILYPVIGFPAMVTPDEPCFSVIYKAENLLWTEKTEVKIVRIDENGITEYLTLHPYMQQHNYLRTYPGDIAHIKLCTNIILPEAKYDIIVKPFVGDQPEMISRNAVFFPHYEENDPAKFIIVADPQIEDLLSKKTNMNFNPENYPFHADNSYFNYEQQFGLVKATFSQLNSTGYNFSIMLGDIVYGTDFQEEYSAFYDLMLNLEIPMFSIPGNHDGYAHFTVEDNLTTPLEWDGLEYWTRFLGPMNNAFNFRNKTYLLLNAYDGTPQRRASGNPIGIGDTEATPVTNWGGYLAEKTLNWAKTVLEDNDVAAVFGHMMPLGQDGTGKYHKNQAFTKTKGIASVVDEQEWNIDSSSWDSDRSDGIFNETQTSNTGVSLASAITKKVKPPIYFSGHTHHDKVFTFDKGAELIENTGVIAPDKMEFVMTTTMATSGSGDYWGFRKVEMSDNEVSYNYTCERYENCGLNKSMHGMQSVPSGNMWVRYSWQYGSENKESIFSGGDGTAQKVTAEIVNYLPTEEDVTLRFIMPKSEYGYKLDSENFKIVDAAASAEQSKVIIIAKGKIAAGSELDAFYNKNFTKFTDYVTISPVTEGEVPVPEIEYTQNASDIIPASGKVLNSDEFSSLIWRVKAPEDQTVTDFASGDSFTFLPNTITYGTWNWDFYLRYTTLTGASGIVSFTVIFDFPEDENCCGETDGSDNQKPDEEFSGTETDEDNEPDESEEPDEDTETTGKKSSSGCSAIIL